MEASERVRVHPLCHMQWPMLYCGADFVAEGTMLDLSLEEGRCAGTMPVEVGMRLRIYIDAQQKREDLIIEEAVVTWVSDNEFGTQFVQMGSPDAKWLVGYLEMAERRHSFRQLTGLPTTVSDAAGTPLALACKG